MIFVQLAGRMMVKNIGFFDSFVLEFWTLECECPVIILVNVDHEMYGIL